MGDLQNQWISERYSLSKFEDFYENLKDLYNFQSFDYDTMPENIRKKAHELLMVWIDEQFDLINEKPV
jgi:hypothetical protein